MRALRGHGPDCGRSSRNAVRRGSYTPCFGWSLVLPRHAVVWHLHIQLPHRKEEDRRSPAGRAQTDRGRFAGVWQSNGHGDRVPRPAALLRQAVYSRDLVGHCTLSLGFQCLEDNSIPSPSRDPAVSSVTGRNWGAIGLPRRHLHGSNAYILPPSLPSFYHPGCQTDPTVLDHAVDVSRLGRLLLAASTKQLGDVRVHRRAAARGCFCHFVLAVLFSTNLDDCKEVAGLLSGDSLSQSASQSVPQGTRACHRSSGCS
mmetsp:Transcript_34201/g.78909  ORF Transcript_34201/g.78909 Transcript_34201/m.78909 type:complete len:257 (+) Transcript_34201:1888-2658(+)